MYSLDLLRPSSNDNSKELVPDWGKADLDKLAAALAEINWESELVGKAGVESWEYFKAKVDDATEKCVPKKNQKDRIKAPVDDKKCDEVSEKEKKNLEMVHHKQEQQE